MTNLYGWRMSHYLPTGDFHENEFKKKQAAKVPFVWVQPNIVKIILTTNSRTPVNNKCGYLLEGDLKDSSKLH